MSLEQTLVVEGAPPAAGAYPWHVRAFLDGQEVAHHDGVSLIASAEWCLPIVLRNAQMN